ncbi:quinone oxidoreductase-like protein 2 homolog, partial [Elysia marginata]
MSFYTPPEVLLRQCLRSGKIMTRYALASTACSSGPRRGYRAAVINQLGQPIVVESMPPHKPLKASEVLISTHAVGINFADILLWKGQYQVKLEPPFVPGMELSGKVVEVGADVKSYKAGDRVFAIVPNGGFAEMCVADSRVIGVCGGQDKGQFLKHQGVDHVVDYKTEKIRDRVKEITGSKGVNVAVDQVGGETLLDCVK